MIAHLLWSQDGGATAAEINGLEGIAICATAGHARKPTQLCGREQTCLGQPRAGAIRFDDVPDAWVASDETRCPCPQSIPSTSIIE
jgi:hypothetical protein